MPAGRPHEPAGDGRPRWMAAAGVTTPVQDPAYRPTRPPSRFQVHSDVIVAGVSWAGERSLFTMCRAWQFWRARILTSSNGAEGMTSARRSERGDRGGVGRPRSLVELIHVHLIHATE